MKRNYTDRKYGKLVLLHKARSGGHGVGSIWRALCDCGNTVEVLARKVRSGDVTTCGSCRKGLGIQTPNSVVKQGIDKGHREYFSKLIRGRPGAELTAAQYNDMIRLRCIACNIRQTHAEWAGPTSTELIPICDACSKQRKGQDVVKWLGYIQKVADSMRARHAHAINVLEEND